jgi:heparin binding hemagglutinin HbhA
VIIMAVSLPTAADVRKAREQAAKNVSEQAGVVKTPLLAALGATDYAVSTVLGAYSTARARTTEQVEAAQARASELPNELSELRGKLTTDELRKLVEDLRTQAEKYYSGLAKHGETTWGKIRKQPQVKQAFSTVESFTETLDARVDGFVDDAHDAAEKALSTVTRQTRSIGEKTAQRTQKFAEEVAEEVTEVAADAGTTLSSVGQDAAAKIDEAGDAAAAATRSTTRKAANRTAPKTSPKTATRKPATRRTSTNGSTGTTTS